MKKIKSKWQLLFMFAFPLLWYLIFCYVPMYGLQLAFRDYNPRLGYLRSPLVGLRWFQQFFSSYYWKDAVWNTFSISLYSILIGFPIPILLAIIINELQGKRFKKVLQNITYIPHFISTVVLCGMLYLFLSRPCQCLANGLRSLRQRFRKHMGVDIFRCPGVAVAEMLGNDFRGYAHVCQERGVRVAEVVDVYVREGC